MLPLTILAAQKFSDLLTIGNALPQQITQAAIACNANVPVITAEQVLLSSASSEIADSNIQLTYPRVCLYSSGVKNTQLERFRSLSGKSVIQLPALGESYGDSSRMIRANVNTSFSNPASFVQLGVPVLCEAISRAVRTVSGSTVSPPSVQVGLLKSSPPQPRRPQRCARADNEARSKL